MPLIGNAEVHVAIELSPFEWLCYYAKRSVDYADLVLLCYEECGGRWLGSSLDVSADW